MNRATIPVKLPPSLGNAARKLAEEDGVSLNQWVSLAVAQKITRWKPPKHFSSGDRKARNKWISWRFCAAPPTAHPIQAMNSPLRTRDRRDCR